MVEFRFARFAPGTIPCRDHGPLAQLAERRADNAEVGGSSPPRPTTDRQFPRDEVKEDGTPAAGLLALTHLQRGPRPGG